MIYSVSGPDGLRACLSALPPLDLSAIQRLRQQPSLLMGALHLPRAQLVEAVTELVAYSSRCVAAARQLAPLTPVPVRTVGIVDEVVL